MPKSIDTGDNMGYMEIYKTWLEKATEDTKVAEELTSIKDDNVLDDIKASRGGTVKSNMC